ncbi:MAG: molybdenum hydroxylase, partial [Deltaproteobacteria bacterium]|nr:molybdenum hydroxylase [Deltaproteobacteria bacterium]
MQDEATGCKAAAIVRGGGELGTAVAYALHKAGLRVLVVDRPLPGALRLGAAFAAAAVSGCAVVGGVAAVHCATRAQCEAAWRRGEVPLWTGPEDDLGLRPELLVDARMRGVHGPRAHMDEAPLVVGIGPGFEAGRDVHLVIESNRGPRLGQVLSRGSAEPHTGIPGEVMGHREERVRRAPCAGRMERARELGDFVAAGDVVATVAGEPVRARIG